ncbi:MAG: amidohydrolase family protein [Gammaproteobacteria bacterium]
MKTTTLALAVLVFATFSCSSFAQDASQLPQTLFTNVNIFNGTDDRLYENHSVLVGGNLIKSISDGTITPGPNATVINGGGRTLMPGLIDSHVHFYLSMDGGRPAMEASRWDYMASMGAAAAGEWIADGFTTVRDMGGMLDGLRTVIDAGLIDGPRMYLAGATISQSSGHADMTLPGMNNNPSGGDQDRGWTRRSKQGGSPEFFCGRELRQDHDWQRRCGIQVAHVFGSVLRRRDYRCR